MHIFIYLFYLFWVLGLRKIKRMIATFTSAHPVHGCVCVSVCDVGEFWLNV